MRVTIRYRFLRDQVLPSPKVTWNPEPHVRVPEGPIGLDIGVPLLAMKEQECPSALFSGVLGGFHASLGEDNVSFEAQTLPVPQAVPQAVPQQWRIKFKGT